MRVQRVINAQDYEKTEVFFKRATEDYPNFFWAYRSKLENMMPKWGGNWDSMFSFATMVSEDTKPKTLLPLIFAYALEEAANRSPNKRKFLNQPNVWNTFEQIYNRIIRDFPESSLWRVRFAQIAYVADKEDLALKLLETAQKIDPTFFRTYEEKVRFYKNHKRFDMMGKNASTLIKLVPKYDYGHSSLAFSQMKRENFMEAISNYSIAIELNPTKKWYYYKCFCLNQIGEFRKAIKECNKSIELNNSFSKAYYQRGYAYEKLNENKKSKADYKKYNLLK